METKWTKWGENQQQDLIKSRLCVGDATKMLWCWARTEYRSQTELTASSGCWELFSLWKPKVFNSKTIRVNEKLIMNRSSYDVFNVSSSSSAGVFHMYVCFMMFLCVTVLTSSCWLLFILPHLLLFILPHYFTLSSALLFTLLSLSPCWTFSALVTSCSPGAGLHCACINCGCICDVYFLLCVSSLSSLWAALVN